MKRPLIAIIGRPNVGKSTLFNRLTKSKHAIVDDQPGVTRDRLYGFIEWGGRTYDVIDTGGIIMGADGQIEAGIREQALFAAEEADVVLFMVDATTGMTADDLQISKQLHRSEKTVLVVANKADTPGLEREASVFYKLGAGDPLPISALHGVHMWELTDALGELLPVVPFIEEPAFDYKIAIVGRPNVGKSSLVNLLLGEERMLVADMAGTTRDAVDSRFRFKNKTVVLTDTAGMRRRSKVSRGLESFAMIRSLRAMEGADVAWVLVDPRIGFGTTEDAILSDAWERGIGVIVSINKWDIVEKSHTTAKEWEDKFYDRYPQYEQVPINSISVHEKQRVYKTMETVLKVADNRKRKITTSKLNNWIEPLWKGRPPPSIKGKTIKVKYITQTGEAPPRFALFCTHADFVPDAYRRFIERKFREQFGMEGVPLRFEFRNK